MLKDKIRQIVQDQAHEVSMNSIVSREAYALVESFIHNKQVIVLTGIRRCGKSTLMHLIRKHTPASNYYLNFDDDRLLPFELDDFDRLIEVFIELYGVQDHFYFDEIQNIPGWERFVRRLHNAGKKVFVTGSNASLLSKELGTHLTGRHISVALFPFSFQEVVSLKLPELLANQQWTSTQIALVKKCFAEFKVMGGMPEYLENKQKQYLHTLYESILYKDIIVRHKLTQEKPIKEMIYYLASNNTKLFTYNALRKMTGLASANTVSSYCHFLENSYLCFVLNRFSYSLKKQMQFAKKIYFIDQALAESVGFRFSEERGRTLENIVFLHLKRHYQDIYFHQEKKECDFLIRDGYKISQAIQVCESISDPVVKHREVSGLVEAMQLYHLIEGLIITEDESSIETMMIDGQQYTIHIEPCWRWLLNSFKII